MRSPIQQHLVDDASLVRAGRSPTENHGECPAPTLFARACDCVFPLQCADEDTAAAIVSAFSGLLVAGAGGKKARTAPYRVSLAPGRGFVAGTPGGDQVLLDDLDRLLFHLDKHFITELQHRRSDLYFLHAAAVAFDGRVAVLPAPAATGKSTLTFALVGHGGAYLSDELAPVDPRGATVYPYPHAICLKSNLPQPYRLPAGTLAAGNRYHIPTSLLHCPEGSHPLPIAAFFFVERSDGGNASCRALSVAGAVAHLMANSLNALAHPGCGLDAAVRLAERVPSFALDSSMLPNACAAVTSVLREI